MLLAHAEKTGHRPDYFLLATVFILTVFGIAMLASASSELGKIKFDDSYYYLEHQVLYGLLVGLVGFGIGATVNYQHYKRWAFPLLIASIVCLGLVFTNLGVEVRNATRWLRIGPISFQPAEIMKLAFVIYLAAWLANPKMKRGKNFFQGLLPFLAISGVIAGLLILQPATSTVVILLSAGLVIYFLSGAEIKYILGTFLIGIIALGAIIYATPYRLERITGFLNQSEDTLGTNYHVTQSLIAIGSGGLGGRGYGQSITKVSYLPTPIDDSIFAVIGEELGFFGAGGLVALFAILTLRIFWLAKNVRDRFGKLILVGFGTIIAFQSIVNMAAISGLAPLTGVPLPFISYGGTALAVFLTMSGIAVNISKYS
ncbi:cell division protein FtsW [Candidatus Parcubacteria bacterium]|nr:MAG: cell division protein FtsW [Candidatus Parcubacteria bacterium]